MKTTSKNGRTKAPDELALRALRRAARKVRVENRRLGLPLIIYKDGKTVAVAL